MSEADNYEQRVHAIQLANQPILDDFQSWLKQSGLSESTIKDHVDNLRFFTRYLVYYGYSLKRLDEATSGDVSDFLEDWFPRKALWASVASMKGYLAPSRNSSNGWENEAWLLPKPLMMSSLCSKTVEMNS